MSTDSEHSEITRLIEDDSSIDFGRITNNAHNKAQMYIDKILLLRDDQNIDPSIAIKYVLLLIKEHIAGIQPFIDEEKFDEVSEINHYKGYSLRIWLEEFQSKFLTQVSMRFQLNYGSISDLQKKLCIENESIQRIFYDFLVATEEHSTIISTVRDHEVDVRFDIPEKLGLTELIGHLSLQQRPKFIYYASSPDIAAPILLNAYLEWKDAKKSDNEVPIKKFMTDMINDLQVGACPAVIQKRTNKSKNSEKLHSRRKRRQKSSAQRENSADPIAVTVLIWVLLVLGGLFFAGFLIILGRIIWTNWDNF